jgi:hypothetical protein
MENKLLILILISVIIFTALGTTIWSEKNQITSSPVETCTGENVKVAYSSTGDPQANYLFGARLAISGDTLVVVARGANQNETGTANTSGIVYVYEDGNYTSAPVKVGEPEAGPPQSNYVFGSSVSISGDTLAVGASGSNQNGFSTANQSGIVYVYSNGNYTSTPVKVANPTEGPPLINYRFGNSISISGDTLAVGAWGSHQNGVGVADASGVVYVYTAGNYESAPVKVANPSEGPPLADYRFGWSVSISGDTLAVGAYAAAQNGVGTADGSGCVYVYENGNYESAPVKVANPSEGAPLANYNFGWIVSISGDTLVVGAIGATQSGVGTANQSGCVYVYSNGNYTSTPTKVASPSEGSPLTGYNFGYSVYISGDTLVVGAIGAPQNGTGSADNSGLAYVYKNGNYDTTPTTLTILDATPVSDYSYGAVVTADGNTVVVGASGQPSSGVGGSNGAGGAYVYPCAGF